MRIRIQYLRYIPPIACILSVCVVGNCEEGQRQDSIHSGKSLVECVDRLGDPKTPPDMKKEAAQNIQTIGTNAIPFLVDQIKQGNAINGQRRIGVVQAFTALGNSGKTAIPILAHIIGGRDEKSAYTALWCLSNMGGSGATAMVNALTNSDLFIRRNAAQMLYTMGTNAHSSVPILLSHLKKKENDYETAFWTGSAAAAATLQPRDTIAELTTNLVNGNNVCRYGSAVGLGQLGQEAKEAIPFLKILLEDTNENVRYSVSNALSKIQEKSQRKGKGSPISVSGQEEKRISVSQLFFS